jgi:hypothetical protein
MRPSTLLLALLPALTACGQSSSPVVPSESRPPPTPPVPTPPPSTLAAFVDDDTGFQTSDLRDAQNQVIQFNNSNELIWTADLTRLPGYRVTSHKFQDGRRHYFVEGNICETGCAFEVRFGSENGERRAYLTVDYGHDNPGTVVDVEVVNGVLQVVQTGIYPPGTPTLSGVVTGTTARGPVRLEGVEVLRSISTGWRVARTDRNGFYEIPGLIDGGDSIYVKKAGYETRTINDVVIAGNTRFDIELAEVSSP